MKSNHKNYTHTRKKVHYTRFLLHLGCHEWSAGAQLRLLCYVGHAEAAFAVNAAVMAS